MFQRLVIGAALVLAMGAANSGVSYTEYHKWCWGHPNHNSYMCGKVMYGVCWTAGGGAAITTLVKLFRAASLVKTLVQHGADQEEVSDFFDRMGIRPESDAAASESTATGISDAAAAEAAAGADASAADVAATTIEVMAAMGGAGG